MKLFGKLGAPSARVHGTPPSTIRQGTLEYRPAIDGLRALAVLSVFIFHLNHSWLPGGFVGVDVFFVISGYLITSIIFKELQSDSFSLGKFYQRRIARIFPAFFIVGLATLVGSYFIYSPQNLASAGGNLAAASLSMANMKFMLEGNYFEISPDAQPLQHYWSLSVEEQFYIFFPLFLLLAFKYARRHLVLVLSALCLFSFLASVLLTQLRPIWAFYLLPSRAWELLAGCILAVIKYRPAPEARWPGWLSDACFALMVLSFLLVREGPCFPGYLALLPVVGAFGVLMPIVRNAGVCEKLLATSPLILVGRMSYSLYLWHWPVFSLIDYRMYQISEPVRLALKISLGFLTAVLSFWLIENPARLFLNRRGNMSLAYRFLFCALILCVPLGIAVRKANYVSATASEVVKGGLVFDTKKKMSSTILMGDSTGSMYGKLMKEICGDLNSKLAVISVSSGDPLPLSNVMSSQLWLDSLAVVQKEKPDYLVLSCCWVSVLKDDKERLALAVAELKRYVGHMVILNQIPLLPVNASRFAIRRGARPPFYEEDSMRRCRLEINDYLKHFNSEDCMVVDIASHFLTQTGEIIFLDEQGRELYHDPRHLSAFGADRVRSELKHAVEYRMKVRL
jgi:peptidoglycan/LPS O-acetylase OafA/YrhL